MEEKFGRINIKQHEKEPEMSKLKFNRIEIEIERPDYYEIMRNDFKNLIKIYNDSSPVERIGMLSNTVKLSENYENRMKKLENESYCLNMLYTHFNSVLGKKKYWKGDPGFAVEYNKPEDGTEIPEYTKDEKVLVYVIAETFNILYSRISRVSPNSKFEEILNSFNGILIYWAMQEKADLNFDYRFFNALEMALAEALHIAYFRNKAEKLKQFTERIDVTNGLFKEMPPFDESELTSSFDEIVPATFQSSNYWDYAYHIYNKNEDMTWPDVFEKVTKEQEHLDMDPRYSTFDSFKRNKSVYDNKRKE